MVFFFQAEDGIRALVRSRGLGDVYKRQALNVFSGIIAWDDDRNGHGTLLGVDRSFIGIGRNGSS